MVGYVLDYFLAGSSDFKESLLIDWQPHCEDMTFC